MDVTEQLFIKSILDYAGLFPPARLSLNESMENYSHYCCEPEAWLLARFVCPVGLLDELGPYIGDLFGDGPPLRVSAIGRGGDTESAFLDNLLADLEAINRFRRRNREGVVVECIESRLPGDLSRHMAPDRLLAKTASFFKAANLAALTRFFEVPLEKDCRSTVHAIACALADANTGQGRPLDRGAAGIKLRCGGTEPAAVPSTEQVATVIEESVRARVPLKFTAGLHHPIRQLDPALGVYVHGFLNVFAAGILDASLDLDHDDLLAVVEEEDIRQFSFSDDFFSWGDAEATRGEIEYARQHCVISFGSCSFIEPRDEMRELGLI
jgi:hypothetical protein